MELKKNLKDAVITGTIVAMSTAVAGSLYAAADRTTPVAPTNAVSHIVWGNKAMRQDKISLKYTGTGALLHYLSSLWWAFIYEWLFGRKAETKGPVKALRGGIIVAGLAYLVDYHLIPDRLSPGFETRLSKYALPLMFGVIALTLPVRGILKKSRA